MSLLEAPAKPPVHFPQDPACFSFDKEVSKIFPNMALRAIPNFYEAHAAHARMLKSWVKPGLSILDAGASRGAFFQAIEDTYPEQWDRHEFQMHAVDISADMCEHMRCDLPELLVQEGDISSPAFKPPYEKYDVVCLHYVLQFIPVDRQMDALRRVVDMVKPGGVFIYGHKGAHVGAVSDIAHEEYMRFRLGNGYTPEEIAAKTKALKGSMFPVNNDLLVTRLKFDFREVMETFRFMMFSTIFAVK